jgi:hypothetical protein
MEFENCDDLMLEDGDIEANINLPSPNKTHQSQSCRSFDTEAEAFNIATMIKAQCEDVEESDRDDGSDSKVSHFEENRTLASVIIEEPSMQEYSHQMTGCSSISPLKESVSASNFQTNQSLPVERQLHV